MTDRFDPPGRSRGGEFLESVVVALILAILIRLFILQPFYIPSGSMEPTLLPGDRIVVGKVGLFFGQPKPGDVVVFHYPLDPRQDFVKRLIASGGQTVELRQSRLYIDGKLVAQPYLPPGLTFADFGPVTVPSGTYFMLGDNRNNSDDSRVWGFVKQNLVVGRVLFIYWPLDRIGVVP